MAPIATIVFLDLETTGLPKEELNKTKITEISLIAVKRSHILDTQPGSSPRVLQKLSLCLNPHRTVHPVSTKITGLCNWLLEHEPSFNKAVFDTINNFLNLLSKPVCLVAHNGITYDYPILKKHLLDLNVSFADDLLCADSLHCFYDIETRLTGENSNIIDGKIDVGKNTAKEDFLKNIQAQNESTPKKSSSGISGQLSAPRKLKVRTNPGGISKVRRKIFFDGNPNPSKSYKLDAVYKRFVNRDAVGAHRAENDCVMALECSVAKAEEFVKWIDNNHCAFADIKSMTIGVPLGY